MKEGTPLLQIEASVQRALAEQQLSQVAAAEATLDELKAQPRRESLEVARAQVEVATAAFRSAQDQLDKQRHAVSLDPRSISRDALDNATNAAKMADANLHMVTRQYELTKAGAWIYQRRSQERQVEALRRAAAASTALLARYTVRAPVDGVVLSIRAAVGSYLSPQGVYDPYTQGFVPTVVMGGDRGYLGGRCYIDEILIPRLMTP